MVRRARPIVRAVTGISLVKRILVDNATVPDVTTVDYDNPLNVALLQCIEAQDEEQVSDGTVIADAPLYSRITGIRLKCIFQASTAVMMRWMVYKSPDNDITVSSLINGGDAFHSSNDTPTAREIRKNTLAKGFFWLNADRQASDINVRISKAALQRVSPLRENDQIKFVTAKAAAGTAVSLNMMGQIYLRANG